MKKLLYITLALFIAIALYSCKAKQHVVYEQRDSIRIEYREKIVKDTDSVLVYLPSEEKSISTYDSTSHLKTKYAESIATISSGMLTHTLKTIDNPVPVQVVKETIYKDSISYKDKIVEKEVQVEVEKELSWIQKTLMWLWVPFAVLLGIAWRKNIWKLIKLVTTII